MINEGVLIQDYDGIVTKPICYLALVEDKIMLQYINMKTHVVLSEYPLDKAIIDLSKIQDPEGVKNAVTSILNTL